MNFNLNGHMGRVVHNEEVKMWIKEKKIASDENPTQCFPLYSLLLALNQTRVDFLSLDIEGDELYVLKTIPFDKVDIRMMTVEVARGKGGVTVLDCSSKEKDMTVWYWFSAHGMGMLTISYLGNKEFHIKPQSCICIK